jgi:hypothetical protein
VYKDCYSPTIKTGITTGKPVFGGKLTCADWAFKNIGTVPGVKILEKHCAG